MASAGTTPTVVHVDLSAHDGASPIGAAAVDALLAFRDFNRWLLPLKDETPRRNGWVLAIPMLQWTLACAIVGVSCTITCACTTGFDAVMNSLAFTFISTVAEVFNQPLLKHYSAEAVNGLDTEVYGSEPIYYLVAEYDEANSFGAQQWAQWAASWYIKQDDKVAGLLTDFCFRHEPDSYARPNRRLARVLRVGFFCVPPAALAVCWALFTPRG